MSSIPPHLFSHQHQYHHDPSSSSSWGIPSHGVNSTSGSGGGVGIPSHISSQGQSGIGGPGANHSSSQQNSSQQQAPPSNQQQQQHQANHYARMQPFTGPGGGSGSGLMSMTSLGAGLAGAAAASSSASAPNAGGNGGGPSGPATGGAAGAGTIGSGVPSQQSQSSSANTHNLGHGQHHHGGSGGAGGQQQQGQHSVSSEGPGPGLQGVASMAGIGGGVAQSVGGGGGGPPGVVGMGMQVGSNNNNNNNNNNSAAIVASIEGNLSDEHRRLVGWVAELLRGESREQALMELSKKREQVPELALIIWHSFGVMTTLVQEIIQVYPLLNPSQLTAAASNRVCNALALLQCVASHIETRGLFLSAHIPLFLYPFLNTISKSRPFEYLRLTSLGVIGALVKNDSTEVINFLLQTEIIPLCLRIMETGSELSKTVAIFIVQKILLDDIGLSYICHTYERFYAVGTVLSNMVTQLVEQQTVRLLKHVVRCFLRLSDNARAREALRQCLPEPLRDATFSPVLRDDAATKRCLAQLLINLSDNVMDSHNSGGM